MGLFTSTTWPTHYVTNSLIESVNPNTYILVVLRLSSNGQAQTWKALYINVMFSDDTKLMIFFIGCLYCAAMDNRQCEHFAWTFILGSLRCVCLFGTTILHEFFFTPIKPSFGDGKLRDYRLENTQALSTAQSIKSLKQFKFWKKLLDSKAISLVSNYKSRNEKLKKLPPKLSVSSFKFGRCKITNDKVFVLFGCRTPSKDNFCIPIYLSRCYNWLWKFQLCVLWECWRVLDDLFWCNH